MLCPANILGYLLTIRLVPTGAPHASGAPGCISCVKLSSRAEGRPFFRAPVFGAVGPQFEGSAFSFPGPTAPSFRAECPALLPLREAPGHAAEESLFNVIGCNIHIEERSAWDTPSSRLPFAGMRLQTNRPKSLPQIAPAQARSPDRTPSSIPASAVNRQTPCPTRSARS